VRRTRCAHFGLLVGEHVNLQSLGIAGRLALNTRSVGAALQELIAYFALHDNGGVPSLAIHDATASYAYGLHTPGIRSADQVYDLSAVALRNILRQLCGPAWRPDFVLLPRHRPADLRPYREILASPIRFDAVQCAINFPAAWLQQPLADADPLLHSLLRERAVSVLAAQHPPLRTEVRRVVRLLLAGGECSRAAAAAQLGMHERTLGRRLQEAGTTFQALLDEARSDLARQLLRSTRTPVARISTSLGYRDPTVFTRAFRRWTGVTPRQFRGSVGGHQ
jgi:AraC-like DNA-binding protein